jgi:hypothetical protein
MEDFHSQWVMQVIQNCRMWDVQNLSKWIRLMKRFLFEVGQNVDIEKSDWRSAWSLFVTEVFSTLLHVLTRAADSLPTVASIFELRLKLPMNLVRHEVFLVEKSNNHSSVGVHSAKRNPTRPWWPAKLITIFRPLNLERRDDSINKVNNRLDIHWHGNSDCHYLLTALYTSNSTCDLAIQRSQCHKTNGYQMPPRTIARQECEDRRRRSRNLGVAGASARDSWPGCEWIHHSYINSVAWRWSEQRRSSEGGRNSAMWSKNPVSLSLAILHSEAEFSGDPVACRIVIWWVHDSDQVWISMNVSNIPIYPSCSVIKPTCHIMLRPSVALLASVLSQCS